MNDQQTVMDPHHGGQATEWVLHRGNYYQRSPARVGRWVKVTRLHPTPARLAALVRLVDQPQLPVRGVLMCGDRCGISNWPCSKVPGHFGGHENAFAFWSRQPDETCEPESQAANEADSVAPAVSETPGPDSCAHDSMAPVAADGPICVHCGYLLQANEPIFLTSSGVAHVACP